MAGEDYAVQEARRQNGIPAVAPDAVQAALTDVLAKGPRSLSSACDLVAAVLRKTQPRLRKADVDMAIEDLFESGGVVDAWEGPRGTKMVGLPGSQGEAPEDKALRLALENPRLSVRELTALAGCRTATASEALRVAKSSPEKARP